MNASASADGAVPATAVGFQAAAWRGDDLDWYDVDAPPAQVSPPTVGAPATPTVSTFTGPVTGLSYPGMPAARWWEFEDAHVSFPDVTAAPTDLARMIVVEFACAYSNDWYLRPVVLPVGTLSRITQFTVTTTFGDVVPIGEAGAERAVPDWCLFRNTVIGSTQPLTGLLLWPAIAVRVLAEPREVVQFARDETANLAWALELMITGQDGVALDRHAAATTAADGGGVLPPMPTPVDPDPALHYQIESSVPEYWFPLVADPDGASLFDLRLLRRYDVDGTGQDIAPLGRLLATGSMFHLWQEEIPREGTQTLRRTQLTRDNAGNHLAWTARTTTTGRGPSSSALRYDQATGAAESTS